MASIKIIHRPPKAQFRYRTIQQEVAKQVGGIGRLHVQERARVVADFEHKPEFGYEVKVTPGQVALNILVVNDGEEVSDGFTIGDLWKALDQTGTRPHVIEPKKQGGRLAFRTNYQARTRPTGRFGGPGQATGDAVYAKRVNHPGFPPRKLSPGINKRLRPGYLKAISRGVSLGWKKEK